MDSEMREAMSKIDARFDALSFDMNHRFDQVGRRFDETDERIDVLARHVDGFVHLHQTVDTELAVLRGRQDRLEGKFAS